MKLKSNWFYVLIIMMFGIMLYISAIYFKGSGESSIGIAQTSEYKINSEKAAQVKAIHVIPGMEVKAGQLLVELTSESLEMDILKLSNRIAVSKSELIEKSKLAESEIAYIKAQNQLVLEELESKIQELESEIQLNGALTKSLTITNSEVMNSPTVLKINSLNEQKKMHLDAMNIKISNVNQESKAEQQTLKSQIELLMLELSLLETEQKNLNKYAIASGVVNKVYVKPGEQVDSFTPLLEINPLHPTIVVAYLVGKKTVDFPVGKLVTVSSYDQRRNTVEGKVIGYGSVSELPEILQKSTATKAFGQELFIEIPDENTYFNGEKILIR
ncbi:HlyD family secretion protein [Algoriphagus sanaruensis]|uniref:Uncharacterized protein n=1 Tax=Algoriphagus sanaruensis TaxID=1727163 RepID=A0A142EPR7_9BACT|nr:HlyD family efflux transporter periplasmic adaptor subunit [Algoriphagus sanaruensis]AMQ57122.1 hypothetical protein AO498_11795 [Algoriphagus sanaruensis]